MNKDVQALPIFTAARWDPSRGWIEESANREDLNSSVYRYQMALKTEGIAAGDRVAILLKNPLETVVMKLAAESIGAVAAVVEPGLGTLALTRMLATFNPRAFISSLSNHRWTLTLSIPLRFTVGERGYGVLDLRSRYPAVIRAPAVVNFQDDGSDAIELVWSEGDAYENLKLGVRTLLPAALELAGEFEPATVLDQIRRHGVTRLRAPARVVEKIARHLHSRGLNLPSIRRIELTGNSTLSSEIESALAVLFPRSEEPVDPNNQRA